MKATISLIAAFAVLGIFLCPSPLHAQTYDNLWSGSTGNWTDYTWSAGGIPDNYADDRAIIGSNGSFGSPTGVVNVTSDIRLSYPSPAVLLGDGLGTDGTLNISSSGALSVEAGLQNGDFVTGINGGVGTLSVAGILEIDGQLSSPTSASADTSITLSGSASVSADSGYLDRTLVVDGANVSLSFTNDLILGQAGTHTWSIPTAGASTISVGGNADLGGTLKVEFPDGATVGSTWDLIDSATVDDLEDPASGFSWIDQSAVKVDHGQKFVVNTVAGGTNGQLTQLSLEQHPVLVVDRVSGATSIVNYGTAATIGFDAYTIGSAQGSLVYANWSSIDPNNGWQEANPSSTALAELNPLGSESVAASSSIDLGTPVQLPTPTVFGQEIEDITFTYGKPGSSETFQGEVIYTGVPTGTLTLNVDPNTGEAQIINGTSFTVSIEAYDIFSATESLDFVNGTWESLEDQAESSGNWYEANASKARLSELLAIGGLELAPNAMVPIGSPFDDVDGIEDLTFQFALYENRDGDFDNDGDVDGNDFLEWQRGNSPDPLSAADLAAWQSNYGATIYSGVGEMVAGKVLYTDGLVTLGGGGIAAVPEPTSAVLLLVGGSLLAVVRRRAGSA